MVDHSNYDRAAREWDANHIIHPWHDFAAPDPDARSFVTHGEGVYIRTDDGRRLLDGPGGMWCVQIGYDRPEMADAMADQARRLPYFSPFNASNAVSSELAGKLAEISPGDLNNVCFTTGGSTAVDAALRFVQFRNNVLGRPEKKRFISRQFAYHGSTYLSASVSGKERDGSMMDVDQSVRILPDVCPSRRPAEQSEAAFLEEKIADLRNAVIEIGPDTVAAFIAEPILASGGVIIPPAGYHAACKAVCEEFDVVYISDEVVTGFGRLGHWFASQEVYGITPDIITSAKGLTSGYAPLGACLISDRLLEGLGEAGQAFKNGFTYSGHPVSSAAALKNIEIFERDDILAHVREVTPLFQRRLQALQDHPLVCDARGAGLVGCLELSADGARTPETLARDYQLGALVDQFCQKRGLMVRPIINLAVMSPPLVITQSEIGQMFDILAAALDDAKAVLARPPQSG
ncbi:MAG: aminotransferase class III-fold pyridoxal phosphate-dependent enzyme [Paracoccaceae bacterium]|nr:aminotransferase class III-fold pyridoxal phosphate-dependent enzyme [Paracoccaceae bacterium]MDG1370967.1 aminotransferase class III-fold pyridoxal phosphate-dependent enzyme [Paracoccaceae bacterium]